MSHNLFAMSFQVGCLGANVMGLCFLFLLIFAIFIDGSQVISLNFIFNYPSRIPSQAGIFSAFFRSLSLIFLVSLCVVPIGIGTGIYLEEYQKKNRILDLLKINIQNLAGVPSIIYGVFGLSLFVQFLDLGRSLLAGVLTMLLLLLPIMTITTQEALKAIPTSLRLAGYAIGMTRRQVIFYHLLPMAMPGITTGVILALSRGIGETAPLVVIGALTFVTFIPSSIFDEFTVLPLQIFNWASRPQAEFHSLAAGAIVILLLLLLVLNAFAIYLRIKYKRKMKRIDF